MIFHFMPHLYTVSLSLWSRSWYLKKETKLMSMRTCIYFGFSVQGNMHRGMFTFVLVLSPLMEVTGCSQWWRITEFLKSKYYCAIQDLSDKVLLVSLGKIFFSYSYLNWRLVLLPSVGTLMTAWLEIRLSFPPCILWCVTGRSHSMCKQQHIFSDCISCLCSAPQQQQFAD